MKGVRLMAICKKCFKPHKKDEPCVEEKVEVAEPKPK